MGSEMLIGFVIGALFIYGGYIVRTKKVFAFLADVTQIWEPVNRKRLGNRVGVLLMIAGIIAILTSIFTIWFGAIAEKISGVLAVIDALMIIMAVLLDQMGY